MSANTWFEALPSDASLVAISPTDMRSHWTSIAVGLINALYWAGSGGASQLSSGELYPGATRTFLGATSVSSNGAENLGKLFLASSDSSFLYLYESAATHKVGGPGTVSHGSTAHGAVWVEQRGTFSTDEGDTATSFTTAYDAPPMVWLTASEASSGALGDAYLHGVLAISASGFTATSQNLGGGGGITTVRWTSLGTVSGEF